MIPAPASRPRLDIARTGADTALEIAGLTLLAGYLIWFTLVWPTLPSIVPQHMGLDGTVDRWGDRSSFLALPIVATLLFTGLSVLSRFPHLFNFPVPLTAANAPALYRVGISMLRWLKIEIVATFAVLSWEILTIARGEQTGLGRYDIIIMVALIFTTLGVHIRAMYKAR